MATLLFRLVLISIISINLSFGSDHIFSPKLGSASFLLSPQSHFAPASSQLMPQADIKRNIIGYKESGKPAHILQIVSKLSDLAEVDRVGFEALKYFLEYTCLTDDEIFPFGQDIIGYGRPFERGGRTLRIEFLLRENAGIRVREIDATYLNTDEAITRLAKRIPMSTIGAVLSDLKQAESAKDVLRAFQEKGSRWTHLDVLVFYGGGSFIEFLFKTDPNIFLWLVDTYGDTGLIELDAKFDALLLDAAYPNKVELKHLFSVFYESLLVRHSGVRKQFLLPDEGAAAIKVSEVYRRQGAALRDSQMKLYLSALALLTKSREPKIDSRESEQLRTEADRKFKLADGMTARRDELIREYHKWGFAQDITRWLAETPVSLKIGEDEDASIPLKTSGGGSLIFGKCFPNEWGHAKQIIRRGGLKEIFFEASADEECLKPAIVQLFTFLLQDGDADVDLREGIALGRRMRAQVVDGNRLSVFKVDPYDDRLAGEKIHLMPALKPAIIYLSAFFNANGSERFPDAKASLERIEKETIPFRIDKDITAEEALKQLYNRAIADRITIPKDGRIPVIIPEEAKELVMGSRLPERAFLFMIKQPQLDEVVGYKAYRFLMAILYGTGMDEIKNIIVEDDPAQNEALDTKITITPVEVGQGYLTLTFPDPSLRQSP